MKSILNASVKIAIAGLVAAAAFNVYAQTPPPAPAIPKVGLPEVSRAISDSIGDAVANAVKDVDAETATPEIAAGDAAEDSTQATAQGDK